MAAVTAHSVQNMLLRLLDDMPDLLVIGESVGAHGADRASSSLVDNAVKFPIADRGNVAVGVGRALGTLPTVVVLADAGRLLACLEVFDDIALFRGGQEDPPHIPLVVRVPCDLDSDLSALLGRFSGQDHLRVVAPSTGAEASMRVEQALTSGTPTLVLEHSGLVTGECASVDEPGAVLRQGHHATLVSMGPMDTALIAAERLSSQGIEIDVLDWSLLSSKPRHVVERVKQTGRLVTAGSGSFRKALETHVLADAFLYLESPFGGCPADVEAICAAVQESVTY